MKSRVTRTVFAAVVGFALMVGSVRVAHAGPATDVMKTKQTALRDLLAKDSAESKKKSAALMDELFDYATMAEGALGTEWSARTAAEKAQFTDLLKQLVRASYESDLKKSLSSKIEYVAEEATAGGIVVKTKAITPPPSEPASLDFVGAQKGGVWKVQDIVSEGVSLVSSYRSQFTKIVKKDGFPALVAKMKERLVKGT